MFTINDIETRLKKETNNCPDINFRKKIIGKKEVCVIYNEPITSSDKISDFIIRSLNNISYNNVRSSKLISEIENNISNFKVKKISTYKDLCLLLHSGFTIIVVDDENYALALETKGNINRSISTPDTENALRGSKDAFVEDYQINVGLIKKRIRTNDLWIENMFVGKYTNTKVGVIYINGVVKEKLVKKVKKQLEKINIDGIINSESLKDLIDTNKEMVLPTIATTERPDIVSTALLEGKIAIVVDNSPYVLIIPGLFNDYFKTTEDFYAKGTSATFTRILKYISFFIALLAPGIYISLITYNQEMIPTELLISFAIQRDGVPFPAFFECIIMIIAFELLRESDLRVPSFTGSALSIVGALILGEAAVNAGIVSPIMIIIVAITAICSLPFTEPGIINALRLYRLIFMIGASFLGIIGIVIAFLFFIIKLTSMESFGIPYLVPYVPAYTEGLKDSIFKLPLFKRTKRAPYLSENITKQKENTNEKN